MYGDTEVMRAHVGRLREQAGDLRAAADLLERHLLEVDRRKDAIAATQRRADALAADGTLPDIALPAPGHKGWLEVSL